MKTNPETKYELWHKIGIQENRRRAQLRDIRDELNGFCETCPIRRAGHCSGGKCSIYVALHGKGGICDLVRRLDHPERYKVKLDQYTPATFAELTTPAIRAARDCASTLSDAVILEWKD